MKCWLYPNNSRRWTLTISILRINLPNRFASNICNTSTPYMNETKSEIVTKLWTGMVVSCRMLRSRSFSSSNAFISLSGISPIVLSLFCQPISLFPKQNQIIASAQSIFIWRMGPNAIIKQQRNKTQTKTKYTTKLAIQDKISRIIQKTYLTANPTENEVISNF